MKSFDGKQKTGTVIFVVKAVGYSICNLLTDPLLRRIPAFPNDPRR